MATNNKKIAKNTVMLYFRMILSMIVSLYTSRVVLDVLGVEDFGIYNIVGGVVVMFSFINTFLNSACQRFFSYSLASDPITETKKIFHTSLYIHLLIAIIFAISAETIGLWFMYEKIVIPDDRFWAAIVLYHIYVLNTCLSIFRVPYNAVIIAEEKMDFYAVTTIIESILRLVIVYMLVIIPLDKLITYGFLHTFTALLMIFWYGMYCKCKFVYCTLSIKKDKRYLRNMLSFSGWNMFASIADIGYKQGSNIILNMFFGVTLNAAMGIATTVRGTIGSFSGNMMVAANPQIIKNYALKEYDAYSVLVYKMSKYSFYLMLMFVLPTILNIEYILKIWLVTPPDHTVVLLYYGLIFNLVESLHGPLWVSMQATGKLKQYQIVISSIYLLNLPLLYLAYLFGSKPESMLLIQTIISAIIIMVRLMYSQKLAHLNISAYIVKVIKPIIKVCFVALPIPIFISSFLQPSLLKLALTSIISFLLVSLTIYFVGMDFQERMKIRVVIKNKFIKNFKK